MLPVSYDLDLYQGDTRTFGVLLQRYNDAATPELEAVDLTGCTARAQVRQRRKGSLTASFVVAIPDPAAGQLVVTLTHAEATKVEKDGFWDLEVISPDGSVRTWVQGTVTVTNEVTR